MAAASRRGTRRRTSTCRRHWGRRASRAAQTRTREMGRDQRLRFLAAPAVAGAGAAAFVAALRFDGATEETPVFEGAPGVAVAFVGAAVAGALFAGALFAGALFAGALF